MCETYIHNWTCNQFLLKLFSIQNVQLNECNPAFATIVIGFLTSVHLQQPRDTTAQSNFIKPFPESYRHQTRYIHSVQHTHASSSFGMHYQIYLYRKRPNNLILQQNKHWFTFADNKTPNILSHPGRTALWNLCSSALSFPSTPPNHRTATHDLNFPSLSFLWTIAHSFPFIPDMALCCIPIIMYRLSPTIQGCPALVPLARAFLKSRSCFTKLSKISTFYRRNTFVLRICFLDAVPPPMTSLIDSSDTSAILVFAYLRLHGISVGSNTSYRCHSSAKFQPTQEQPAKPFASSIENSITSGIAVIFRL